MSDAYMIPAPESSVDPIPPTIRVVKVTGARGEEEYELLHHVRCLGVSWREGGNPPTAEFIYQFDATTLEYVQATAIERALLPPTRFDQVFPLATTNPYVLGPDDRIAVLMDRPDGSAVVLFDGYPTSPDAQVAGSGESAPFAAMGFPVREFDYPLTGALWRDSNTPNKSDAVQKTDLPARFNPDGKANANPFLDDGLGDGGNASDYIAKTTGYTSPPFSVFMDPDFNSVDPTSGDSYKVTARSWTLVMAIPYVLMGNPYETYTRRPDFQGLLHILVTRAPLSDKTTYDPHDPATYQELDITCQDYDATDKPWPLAVQELIEPHGFGCIWRLDTTEDGKPDWWFDIYRKDDPDVVQPLKHQAAGEALDFTKTNLATLSLSRDSREIINTFAVQTKPNRYQSWFILAPGFAINPTDALTPNNRPYTDFILNENGADGFWDGSAMNYTPADLRKLIQENGLETPTTPAGIDPLTIRRYAIRRRPARRDLLVKDAAGRTVQSSLWIVVGYTGGPVPGVMGPPADGMTAPYLRQVGNGGWEFLKDRCGIRLNAKNVNDWDIGKDRTAPYFANGTVKVVQCLAAPDPSAGNPFFLFAFQTVIEGDRGLNAIAPRRPASPTSFDILRRDDARDQYRNEYVLSSSGTRTVQRDDTATAQSHVDARRAANETPKFAGTATIARITTAYQVGSKITGVDLRNCPFRTTIADGQLEGAQYPSLVGLDWRFDPEYSTILQIDDRRAEPVLIGKEGDLDE